MLDACFSAVKDRNNVLDIEWFSQCNECTLSVLCAAQQRSDEEKIKGSKTADGTAATLCLSFGMRLRFPSLASFFLQDLELQGQVLQQRAHGWKLFVAAVLRQKCRTL